MANIIARIIEKHISKIFSNFSAGKNASSSLFKGEGIATGRILVAMSSPLGKGMPHRLNERLNVESKDAFFSEIFCSWRA